MVSFIYFFWSAMFGGIIGGIFGVMLLFKIYGNEEPEEQEEYPDEEELQPAIQEETISVRDPVEHDERLERSSWKPMSGEFLSFFSFRIF